MQNKNLESMEVDFEFLDKVTGGMGQDNDIVICEYCNCEVARNMYERHKANSCSALKRNPN